MAPNINVFQPYLAPLSVFVGLANLWQLGINEMDPNLRLAQPSRIWFWLQDKCLLFRGPGLETVRLATYISSRFIIPVL